MVFLQILQEYTYYVISECRFHVLKTLQEPTVFEKNKKIWLSLFIFSCIFFTNIVWNFPKTLKYGFFFRWKTKHTNTAFSNFCEDRKVTAFGEIIENKMLFLQIL